MKPLHPPEDPFYRGEPWKLEKPLFYSFVAFMVAILIVLAIWGVDW